MARAIDFKSIFKDNFIIILFLPSFRSIFT